MAHYANRYFSQCIFCLKDRDEVGRLTKEHYFGRTIAKAIPTVGNLSNGSCPISNITLKALCSKCNNDILGANIMIPVTETMISLFSGDTMCIHKSKIAVVKNYFSRLGFLIDIASSNWNIESSKIDKLLKETDSKLAEYDPIMNDTDRKTFITSFKAPKISVEVAHYPYPKGQSDKGRATIRSSYEMKIGSKKLKQAPTSKEFVMVYHNLAFIVRIGEYQKPASGPYPGFKFLPSFYYKTQFDLPVVNSSQLNSLFDSGMISSVLRSP